jgi:hypothetical protein
MDPYVKKTPEGPEYPFAKAIREKGMAQAVKERDAAFDDDVTRV